MSDTCFFCNEAHLHLPVRTHYLTNGVVHVYTCDACYKKNRLASAAASPDSAPSVDGLLPKLEPHMNPIKALQAKWRAPDKGVGYSAEATFVQCASELSPLAEQWEKDIRLIERLANTLDAVENAACSAEWPDLLVAEARARVAE